MELSAGDLSDLCAQAVRGGPDGLAAFEKLVTTFEAPLRTFVLKHAPDTGMAYDLAQEAFIVAWKRLPEFDPRGAFWPWLVGISRGLIRNAWRTLSRERAFKQRLTLRYLVEAETAREGEEDRGLLSRALHSLRECRKRLPERLRALVEMHYTERLSSAEIGARVHSPSGTVRYELSRVRDMLRLCMERRSAEVAP